VKDSAVFHRAITTVLSEILHGASPDTGWLLNPRDPGLLKSLESLSSKQASAVPHGSSSSIASHVDHLRYGLSLLNRWSRGEKPFDDADWGASWRRVEVIAEQWTVLKRELQAEVEAWGKNSTTLLERGEEEVTGVIASAAHLAYHLGAIRQIDAAARGPRQE
jgi:hypothetical protein